MNVVAPITAAYPVMPVAFDIAKGERPTPVQIAGMTLVVAGVIVASYVRERAVARGIEAPVREALDGPSVAAVPLPDVGEGFVERARRDAATHKPRMLASVVLGIIAAFASGTVLTALGSAAKMDPYWGLVMTRGVGLTLMLGFVVVSLSGFGVRPAQVPFLLAIGILDTVSTGLFAVATTHGYLSVVSVVAALFPVGTIALARLALGERIQPHQNAGVVVALTGVALVALG